MNKLRIISNIISYHLTLSHILCASHEEPILESIFTSTPPVGYENPRLKPRSQSPAPFRPEVGEIATTFCPPKKCWILFLQVLMILCHDSLLCFFKGWMLFWVSSCSPNCHDFESGFYYLMQQHCSCDAQLR